MCLRLRPVPVLNQKYCILFSIALFAVTPPHIAATVGSILTASAQFGSAAGTAIITSIQTTVQETHGGQNSFSGRAAGLWFIVAMTGAETLSLLFYMKSVVAPGRRRADQAAEAAAREADAEKVIDEKTAVDKVEVEAEDEIVTIDRVDADTAAVRVHIE